MVDQLTRNRVANEKRMIKKEVRESLRNIVYLIKQTSGRKMIGQKKKKLGVTDRSVVSDIP